MDVKRKAEIVKSLMKLLQDAAIEFMKQVAIKGAMKAFLKTGAGVGFKAWLIKYIVTELAEEFGEPLVKAFFVEAGYQYERINGNILVKKLNRAREDGNVEDYNDTVDDIFDGVV